MSSFLHLLPTTSCCSSVLSLLHLLGSTPFLAFQDLRSLFPAVRGSHRPPQRTGLPSVKSYRPPAPQSLVLTLRDAERTSPNPAYQADSILALVSQSEPALSDISDKLVRHSWESSCLWTHASSLFQNSRSRARSF